jgi:hypothetical protein
MGILGNTFGNTWEYIGNTPAEIVYKYILVFIKVFREYSRIPILFPCIPI